MITLFQLLQYGQLAGSSIHISYLFSLAATRWMEDPASCPYCKSWNSVIIHGPAPNAYGKYTWVAVPSPSL
jgi:hypothetical protein